MLLVAVSLEVRRDPSQRLLLENLDIRDPRVVRTVSVLSLFEQQQERLASRIDRRYFLQL